MQERQEGKTVFLTNLGSLKLPEILEEAVNIGERNKDRGLFTFSCPKDPLHMFKDDE